MLHHACESTHPEPMSQDRPQNLRPQDFHLTHPCFELCRSSSPWYTPHVCQPWTNVPRHTTKPQTPRFSSHTSLFWTLPEQISILYPTCVATHPEPMFQDRPQNLRPQDFHLTHPCFELCRSRSPYYTPHVWQPILNQCPKTHHKTSDPKIFISHIPVLNFPGADLHIIPHMCANPSWTNAPRQTTKPQTPRFSSHTSLFLTFPDQLSMLHHACESTHPEPMSQDRPQNPRPQDFHLTHPCFELCRNGSPYYTPHVRQPILNQCPKRPQNLRPQDFHLTHPCFELCRNRSPYYTPHVWQPILNQCPKTDHKTSDPKIFISHIPVLNFAGAALHGIPHMCANLEPMSQDTPQNLRPQDFHLTHPCFELCRNGSPYYTPHVWQPILNQCPKTDHKTSDPKIFISHIPVLNFAGTDLHIIPHMCANPSWTNVPRHTTKPQTPRFSSHTSLFWTLPEQISILYPTCVPTHLEPMSQDTPQNLRPQDFHLTHPCFELCRSRSPYYTPHVCQPILNQCPKTHHKTSDPKIFISNIPVLNFAGANLHIIPHMCANLEPMSQDTPQNLRPQDFHLTHPCFELCRSRSPYYTPHVCQPILNQCPKTHHKTSDPKIFISHIPVLNFANRSPYYTPHVCQPILNQCPKTHHKTSDPKIFISHIPVLNFAGADLHIIPHMCANPSWTNVPRQTTKPQTPRFSSHTSLFWTFPEQISILYPTCVPTHPEPMSQDRPQNLRPQDFHLTHPCFELCRNRSPYYTPHVCQPILNQCPKTHHKTSDPKIFISHIPVLNLARTDVGFEVRGAPNWSRDSSWTWSLGWKMWKGNKGHAYLNASNLTQGILFFICLIRTTSMPRCFHWISIA